MAGPSVAEHDPALVFMQQLGIHPAEQMKFGWIAEYGLKEEALPPRWTRHTDRSSGHVYYVDRDSQSSTWENPLAPALQRVLETGRLYLQQPSEHFFEEHRRLLWHQHKWEVECWCGPFRDSSGRPYFANSVTGVSSWRDPREETQYIFELESSLLGNLQEVLPRPQDVAPARQHGGPGASPAWHKHKQATAAAAAAEAAAPGAGAEAPALGDRGPRCVAEAWPQVLQREPGAGAAPRGAGTGTLLEARAPRDEARGGAFCRIDGAEILRISESRLTSPATEVITVQSFSGTRTANSPESRLLTPLTPMTPMKLLTEAKQVSISEHKNALEKLGSAAKWLHCKSLEELEAQRSSLSKKMEARLLRKQTAALGIDPSLANRRSSETADDGNDLAARAATEPCVAEPSGIDGAD